MKQQRPARLLLCGLLITSLATLTLSFRELAAESSRQSEGQPSTDLTQPVQLQFHWQDPFTQAEKQKIERWLRETHRALATLVGDLPFTTHLYINRASAGEPVPWANTERSEIQGVHFHVDPGYSIDEFRADWTAPHELSHLVLPYVGRANSWFAEGFASYMQYQVMHKMGVLGKQEMRKRYDKNLSKAAARYSHDKKPFASAASALRAERDYATMYWGGAAFFLEADTQLMNSGKPGLIAALKSYVRCCRMKDQQLDDVIKELDRLSSSKELSTLFTRFTTQPGFPQHLNLDMGPSEPTDAGE